MSPLRSGKKKATEQRLPTIHGRSTRSQKPELIDLGTSRAVVGGTKRTQIAKSSKGLDPVQDLPANKSGKASVKEVPEPVVTLQTNNAKGLTKVVDSASVGSKAVPGTKVTLNDTEQLHNDNNNTDAGKSNNNNESNNKGDNKEDDKKEEDNDKEDNNREGNNKEGDDNLGVDNKTDNVIDNEVNMELNNKVNNENKDTHTDDALPTASAATTLHNSEPNKSNSNNVNDKSNSNSESEADMNINNSSLGNDATSGVVVPTENVETGGADAVGEEGSDNKLTMSLRERNTNSPQSKSNVSPTPDAKPRSRTAQKRKHLTRPTATKSSKKERKSNNDNLLGISSSEDSELDSFYVDDSGANEDDSNVNVNVKVRATTFQGRVTKLKDFISLNFPTSEVIGGSVMHTESRFPKAIGGYVLHMKPGENEVTEFHYPKALSMTTKNGNLYCFKYGHFVFTTTGMEQCQQLLKDFCRLFVVPKSLQLKCPFNCSQTFATSLDLLHHMEFRAVRRFCATVITGISLDTLSAIGTSTASAASISTAVQDVEVGALSAGVAAATATAAVDVPSDPSAVDFDSVFLLSPRQDCSFFVRDDVCKLLHETPDAPFLPVDLIDPEAFPIKNGLNARHNIQQMSDEFNREGIYCRNKNIIPDRTLWSFGSFKKAWLRTCKLKTKPDRQETLLLPDLLLLSFLKPINCWPVTLPEVNEEEVEEEE